MGRLYDELISYQEMDFYPMHMPGHKRNKDMLSMINPYLLDITEIEGFDNLHQSEGILKCMAERLSRLYNAGRSFPLVNGSTVGILAGISALTNRGDKVLLARNCHKSVYHAMILKGLIPVYYYPKQLEEISICKDVAVKEIEEELIRNEGITLVVITSPTYEGVVSDVRAISEVVHRHGAYLLVDEAHGAHFGFSKDFPESAVTLGADIVIQSLHKTLPSFTQTAVLHSNRPEINNAIERYLSIYESSSPSYLLMAGIDRCISMLEDMADELFEAYSIQLNKFHSDLEALKNIKVLNPTMTERYGVFQIDPSKITLSVKGTTLTGHQLNTILREKYHIVMEMETPDYVLGMTSICDTKEGFTRLTKALTEIDSSIILTDNKCNNRAVRLIKPEQVVTPEKANMLQPEKVLLKDSCDRVSAVFVCMYPPGTPLLVPGERINNEIIDYIHELKRLELTVSGLTGEDKNAIEVLPDTVE